MFKIKLLKPVLKCQQKEFSSSSSTFSTELSHIITVHLLNIWKQFLNDLTTHDLAPFMASSEAIFSPRVCQKFVAVEDIDVDSSFMFYYSREMVFHSRSNLL